MPWFGTRINRHYLVSAISQKSLQIFYLETGGIIKLILNSNQPTNYLILSVCSKLTFLLLLLAENKYTNS